MAKPHEVLGVAPDATFDAARAAYKRLAMKYHPDRPGGSIEKFQEVQTAFDALRAKHAAVGPFDDIFTEIAKEYRE